MDKSHLTHWSLAESSQPRITPSIPTGIPSGSQGRLIHGILHHTAVGPAATAANDHTISSRARPECLIRQHPLATAARHNSRCVSAPPATQRVLARLISFLVLIAVSYQLKYPRWTTTTTTAATTTAAERHPQEQDRVCLVDSYCSRHDGVRNNSARSQATVPAAGLEPSGRTPFHALAFTGPAAAATVCTGVWTRQAAVLCSRWTGWTDRTRHTGRSFVVAAGHGNTLD